MLRASLRTGLVVLSLMSLTLPLGCGPRQAEVRSTPRPTAEVSLSITNRLTQPINVYVVTDGTEVFLKQVAANTSELVPVPNLPPGTTVQLRARTADGTRTYTRDNVVLGATVAWEVR
jgi:hypothetical protein